MSGIKTEATQVKLIVNGVDACVAKETGVLAAGAAGVSGNDVATVGQLGLSKFYESSPQPITLAGALTLPHGLGAAPKSVELMLQCVTAQLGYSIGDLYTGPPDAFATTSPDATNVNLRFGSVAVSLINKGTGVVGAMTAAGWNVIVRAWA